MKPEEIITTIYNSAREVYTTLGSGFLESVYQRALYIELTSRGLIAQRETPAHVFYKGIDIGEYRLDLLVEGQIIIEVKAVRDIVEQHEMQLINYIKATGLDYGVLINFGEIFRFRKKDRIYPSHAGFKHS